MTAESAPPPAGPIRQEMPTAIPAHLGIQSVIPPMPAWQALP